MSRMPRANLAHRFYSSSTRVIEVGANMYEAIVRSLPAYSVAVLVLLALFNVGYFSVVGTHFLGVVDVSNIVYSFALISSALLLLCCLIGMALDSKKFVLRHRLGVNRTVNISIPVSGLPLAVALLYPSQPGIPKAVLLDCAIVISFLILAVAMSLRLWMRAVLDEERGLYTSAMVVCAATVALMVYCGRATAWYQMFRGHTYTVVTKKEVFKEAHVLRSSSSGFIIVVAGFIRFLPAAELLEIRDEKELK